MNRMRLFLENRIVGINNFRPVDAGHFGAQMFEKREAFNRVTTRHSMKRFALLSLLALIVTLLSTSTSLGATVNTAGDGNWNSTTPNLPWPGGTVPASGDDVVINPGHDITVTAAATINSITFDNDSTTAATLTVNSSVTLTVTAGITLNNAAADNNTAATIAGAGTINCASVTVGGTETNLTGDNTTILTSTISLLSISGNLNLNGEDDGSDDNDPTFALPSGTVSVGGTVNTDEESGSTVTLTLNTGAETGTLFLAGATPFADTVGAPTFDPAGTGATVNYSGAAQTVRAVIYTNLTLSGSGAKTTTGATVNGTLSMQGTATATGTSPTYGASAILEYKGSAAQTSSTTEFPAAMTADVIIDNASGVTIAATARTLDGNLTLTTGTFAVGTLLSMGATGTPTITRSGGDMTGTPQGGNDYNVTYTGNSKTTGTELDGTGLNNVTDNLTSGQTLTLGAAVIADGTVTIASGVTLDVSASNFAISVGVNWTNNGGTFTPQSGTVTFNSAVAQAINGTATSQTFNNIIVNKAANTLSVSGSTTTLTVNDLTETAGGFTPPATLNINGTFVHTAGTFNPGATVNIKGNWTRNGGTYTIAASDIVTFNGSAAQTINGTAATTFNSLTINNSAGVTNNHAAATSIDDTLTLTSGTFTLTTALTMTAGATAISRANGSLSGTPTFSGTTDVTYTGATGPITTGTELPTSTTVLTNLTINDAGQTVTLNAAVTVNGTLAITAGTFDTSASNFAVTLNGSFTNSGTFTANASIITIGGTSANPSIAGFLTTGALSFTRTASTATLTGGVTAASLTMNGAGTLNLGAALSHQINGDVTFTTGILNGGSSTLSLTGNFTGSGGTFTAGTGTVNFNGSAAQTINRNVAIVFNNLTINNAAGVVLNHATGATTVSGVLTLTTDLTATTTITQSGTSAGAGDVVGTVSRTDVGTTTRSFGNVDVKINAGLAGITSLTVELVKMSPPDAQSAVDRTYTITQVSAGTPGVTSLIRLRYLDSELHGNSEATLELWKNITGTWTAQGQTARDSSANWVEKTNIGTFSDWIINGPTAPTAVDMINLKATRYDGRVLLEWQTGYEINNVGFNIYRDQKGTLTKVTPEPIAGSALIAGPRIEMRAGFAYSWWDNDAENDDDARYWLEDIDLTGRTAIHGPFGALQAPAGDRVPPRGKGRSSLMSALGREASEQGASAPVETMAKVAKLTPARFEVQAAITSLPAVKMSVQREGWYRVEQPELVAAGIPANVDPRRLQLFVDGQEVPMMVTGSKPAKFDAADGVEFYGVGIDSPSTDTHVYWLVAGSQQGQRITNAGGNSTSMAPEAFPYTVERRDKVVYFAGMKNGGGEKFFGPVMFNAQAVDQSLVVRNVAATGSATLEVSVQGLTQSAHNVKVTLNGEELGTIQFSGSAKGVGQYSIAASSLKEGTNQVQLVGPAGFGDMSMVEYVRLTYQHTNMADGNALKFPVTGRHKATIGGFTSSNVRVVDITKPAAPQELDATVIQESTGLYSVSATAPGKGAKTLMAFAADQQKKPTSMTLNQPSNWRKPGREADYLAVTRKELISSLEPLKTQRQSQGLVVAIADIEDVYDEFSFGQKTPQALKDFFAYAKSSWAKKPRFALLAGDATYDPKNYTGTGDNDVVPTKLVETSFNETATDDWFVDFDNDGVPDMAIGRLPVRTVEEATAMVSKIVGYDKSFGTGRVLMVTDQNQGYNFEAADTQLRGLMPASVAVTGIRRGEVGDANARSQLLDGINQGQKLVNFYGHGSTRVWTNAPILSAADAASFVNTDKLALFDAMTCLNGFFHDVTIDSLGEALLKSKGAAIAVWASTGMTDPSAQVLMNEEAIRLLFSGAGLTIGEVTARAKAAAGNPDVRRTWVLLGDPATKIK